MIKQKLALEVTKCTLMDNEDVLFSPMRGRGIFAIVLGLPIALVGLWIMITDPWARLWVGIFALSLGLGLLYLGVRALTASEISIEVADRLIRVRARGSLTAQTWSFDTLENVKGLPSDTGEKDSFTLFRVSLEFKDGESMPLFATADVKKAKQIGQWLDAAFAG